MRFEYFSLYLRTTGSYYLVRYIYFDSNNFLLSMIEILSRKMLFEYDLGTVSSNKYSVKCPDRFREYST